MTPTNARRTLIARRILDTQSILPRIGTVAFLTPVWQL